MSNPQIDPNQIEAAVRELAKTGDEFRDVIEFLQDKDKRTDIGEILKQAGETATATQRSMAVILPAVRDTTAALRSGAGTSEFQNMTWTQRVLSSVIVLAPVFEATMAVIQETEFGGSSWWVSGVAVGLKAVLSGVYALGRSRIKTAAAAPATITQEGRA